MLQPNGLVSPHFREFSKKGKRNVHCTVNVNEQECEKKQKGEEERRGYLGGTKGTTKNTHKGLRFNWK